MTHNISTQVWIALSTSILGLGLVTNACDGGVVGGGGSGGSSSSSSSSTSTGSVGSSSSSTSSGINTACLGEFLGACGDCAVANCCDLAAQCKSATNCKGCFTNKVDDTCDEAAYGLMGLKTCLEASCPSCFPKVGCNPVTNAGCPDDGSGCDLGADGHFYCFGDAAANYSAGCEICSNSILWCQPGLRCHDGSGVGSCTRYCCEDADCGTGSTCDKTGFPDGVGICLAPTTDGGAAACDWPPFPPSNGSCYTGSLGASGGQ